MSEHDPNAADQASRKAQLLLDGIRLVNMRAALAEQEATLAVILAEHFKSEADYWRYRATHDPLTGLVNRAGMQEVLKTTDQPAAAIYSDGTIKPVNDHLGHDRGDMVIRDVAKILQQSTRPTDTVVRLGGDEMVILLDGTTRGDSPLDPKDQLQTVQNRIGELHQEYLKEPHNADLVEVGYDLAVGGAVWQPNMADSAELIQAAEKDMYGMKALQHQARNYLR